MRRMSGPLVLSVLLLGYLVLVPTLAHAQATLAGVVRDTQSVRRQSVLSAEVIDTLLATRTYGALLTAVPGL